MASYPEVVDVVNQIGRTDDGTDTDGYYNSEFFVPLRPEKDWPAVVEQEGWRRWLFGPKRPRTQGRVDRGNGRRVGAKAARRGLEFLAEHPRQRDGGALRNQRRQLAENRRSRLQPASGPRHAGQEHHAERAGARRRGSLQHPGAIAPGIPHRPGKVPAMGRAGGRREQRGRQRPGRQGRDRR